MPITGPMTTSITLGGIRIPSVPPAVMMPADICTSYFDLSMPFAAMMPSSVTEAPTMPLAAPKRVATNMHDK